MGDVLAALVALLLFLVAIGLLINLQLYRLRHARERARLRALGRRIVAELPTGPELTLFTEDDRCLYYGERAIDKAQIRAARVLVNGSPIAATVSARYPDTPREMPAAFEEQPAGIVRDRWDVAIETGEERVVIECGAIRERISQELARAIYDAAAAAVRELDRHAPTTPPR